jgi:DNA segregation ATPase FtsK/SpoIIIE-like protein
LEVYAMEQEIFNKLGITLVNEIKPPLRLYDSPMDLSYIFSNWELFHKAVCLIVTENKATVSLLQIKMRLTYNQASLLIDYMEQLGIIGPYELSREIYVEFNNS